MLELRQSIIEQKLDVFVKKFFEEYYQGEIPEWIKDALKS